MDKETGFITRNILCVPVVNKETSEILGVFQCINKADPSAPTFVCKDEAILETFATEVAETLGKHASQLQLMKAMADAQGEAKANKKKESARPGIGKKANSTGEIAGGRGGGIAEAERALEVDDVTTAMDDSALGRGSVESSDTKIAARRHSLLMKHHNVRNGKGVLGAFRGSTRGSQRGNAKLFMKQMFNDDKGITVDAEGHFR